MGLTNADTFSNEESEKVKSEKVKIVLRMPEIANTFSLFSVQNGAILIKFGSFWLQVEGFGAKSGSKKGKSEKSEKVKKVKK